MTMAQHNRMDCLNFESERTLKKDVSNLNMNTDHMDCNRHVPFQA